MNDRVTITINDHIADVRLNRTDKMNAYAVSSCLATAKRSVPASMSVALAAAKMRDQCPPAE